MFQELGVCFVTTGTMYIKKWTPKQAQILSYKNRLKSSSGGVLVFYVCLLTFSAFFGNIWLAKIGFAEL